MYPYLLLIIPPSEFFWQLFIPQRKISIDFLDIRECASFSTSTQWRFNWDPGHQLPFYCSAVLMSTLWCPFKLFKSDVLEAERTVQKIVFASRFSENSIVRNAGFLDEGSNNQVLIIFFLSIFEYDINFFTFYHFWNVFKKFSFKKIKNVVLIFVVKVLLKQ